MKWEKELILKSDTCVYFVNYILVQYESEGKKRILFETYVDAFHQ